MHLPTNVVDAHASTMRDIVVGMLIDFDVRTYFPFAVRVLIGFKEKYGHFRAPLSNLMIAVL